MVIVSILLEVWIERMHVWVGQGFYDETPEHPS